MMLNSVYVNSAAQAQKQAATDRSPIRLIAGPGTGKSRSIAHRVCWLIHEGISPKRIRVVSFTNSSVRDLAQEISKTADELQEPAAKDVIVTTLHSLALSALVSRQLLGISNPRVLSKEESEEIFDKEFSASSYLPETRCREIRKDWEALAQTVHVGHPSYAQPDPPVTKQEKDSFNSFLTTRRLLYHILLPGELVSMCLEEIKSNTLDIVDATGVDYLIVDEFQDLCPADLCLIEALAAGLTGSLLVAGDDDQSIYLFRYADSSGLVEWNTRIPGTVTHTLNHCFRCTPAILNVARSLLSRNAPGNRLPKNLVSMWGKAQPVVEGHVFAWRYPSNVSEAACIAQSIKLLNDNGVGLGDMLILLGYRARQLPELRRALDNISIPYICPSKTYISTDDGQHLHAILRVIAYGPSPWPLRVLLGTRMGVGAKTCREIADAIIRGSVAYESAFCGMAPVTGLSKRSQTALSRCRTELENLAKLSGVSDLTATADQLWDLLIEARPSASRSDFDEALAEFPQGTNLREICEVWDSPNEYDRDDRLADLWIRKGFGQSAQVCDRLRLMSFHSAKGLSSKIVFIPGLVMGICPSEKANQNAGLTLEAARMLYVGITRAKAACFLSHVDYFWEQRQTRSRFIPQLGVPFGYRDYPLDSAELCKVIETISNMQ